MLIKKTLSLKAIIRTTGHHFIWLGLWMTLFTSLYYFTDWKWLQVPWLPISLVGTAVAFYVGFKNNQAYDRLWEGRKVWGAIVNSSRMWASMVSGFIPGQQKEKQALIYRYIAWIYTLREQLLEPTSWEHVSLRHSFGRFSQRRRKNFGAGLYEEECAALALPKYLDGLEPASGNGFSNQATYILDQQTKVLAALNGGGDLDVFKQMKLQTVVNDCFEHQGKLERIKKFPLPRQYGSFSFVFVCIFIFLLPFGVVGEFHKLGDAWIWLSIPFGMLIGWVYVVMELIGDYSENPFEGLEHDVPMLAICRTIEIDLLNILGETHDLKPVAAKRGVLM